MAVGGASFFPPANPLSVTLAERWDGASWRIVPTPNPPGAAHNSLGRISCPWQNVCFAVGSSASSSGTTTPLVELWNGSSWSIQPSPNIPNAGLAAVSCSGLLACTAVGSTVFPNPMQPVVERWDGTGWHLQSTPVVAGSESSELSAVSCPLKRTCTAVGKSAGGGFTSPLVERWFGRVNAWGLQSAPKPAGAENAFFSGVSCPDGPVCVAVGGSQAHFEFDSLLAERRSGPTWSVSPLPDPPAGTSSPFDFSAVSCPTRRDCHAIGPTQLQIRLGVPGLLAGHFDGSNWQLESAQATTQEPAVSFYPGISCPSRLFCMAVGSWLWKMSGATLAAKWTP